MLRLRLLAGSRTLRVLLACFLVPVVLVSNPTYAAAASTGPWAPVNLSFGAAGEASCEFNIQQFGPGSSAINIGANGHCTGGPDITPGFTQTGEAGASYTITATGLTAAGQSCSGTATGTLGAHPANGTVNTAGSITASVMNTTATDCTIVEVCVEFPGMGFGLGDDCDEVNLPAIPDNTLKGCTHGFPTVRYEYREVAANEGPSFKRQQWFAIYKINGAPPVTTAQYSVYTNWGNKGGQWNISANGFEHKLVDNLNTATSPPLARPASYGTQFYFHPDPWNLTFPDNVAVTVPNATQIQNPGRQVPFFGMTAPEHCRFYYGPRAFTDPNSDRDDPVGPGDVGPPVTQEPTPEPEIEDPELIDPGADYNWLAAIWAILKAIAATLAGLAGAIASAIIGAIDALVQGLLDGIEALFVPETSMQEHAEEVTDAYSGTFPFNFGEAVESMSAGPGVSARSAGDGCPSWTIHGAGDSEYSAVCDSNFTAAIRDARPFLAAGLMVAAFWPLVRGMFYASIPLIKPVPVGSDR